MFEAQLLNHGSEVYSPWMQRGGDNVIFSVEVVDSNITDTFQVRLMTKNSEDTGPGTLVGTSIPSTGNGTLSREEPGVLEELVRYKFFWTGATASDWVLFRMLPPVWYNDVKA